MKIWEAKIGMMVGDRVNPGVGHITGLAYQPQTGETLLVINWDDNTHHSHIEHVRAEAVEILTEEIYTEIRDARRSDSIAVKFSWESEADYCERVEWWRGS